MKTMAGYMADLCNLLSENPPAERESFIKNFVKEVKVIGAEVRLTYTVPMPPKGISQKTVEVPLIVYYGGPWGTVPELLFEKKGLIPALQQMLI